LLEERKGWPSARNRGILHAKTEYVANIDADCYASKTWLKNLVNAFDDQQIGCVVGKTLVEKGSTFAERYYSFTNPFIIEKKIGKSDFVPWGGGNNLMLKEAFARAGGYDADNFTSGADMEFHHRLEKQFGYRTIYVPEAVIFHQARGSIKEFFAVAAKYGHDGFLRSRCEQMNEIRSYYDMFSARQLFRIASHIGGIGYNLGKGLLGHDCRFKLASNWFSIVSISGTLYGYWKARVKKPVDGSSWVVK
jgi:GT2 family glycosyltransferase